MNHLIDIIKELIIEFQSENIEMGTPRHLKIENVPKKATICIGVRRCGKSTKMYQIMQELLDLGTLKQNIVHLNFFDDRLHFLAKDNLKFILEAYYSLYPEKKNSEMVYYFFDEIQVIEGFEPFIERLLRKEKCAVYITGSSAKMLSKEIATEMRGRSLSWELFPFSFKEFLVYKKIILERHLTPKNRLMIQKTFDEFWEVGGFPEVFDYQKHLRIQTHQEYLNAVLFRDLIERHEINHPKAVIDTAHWLINNVGSMYTINSLTGYLKSLGHKIQKSLVSDYLAWFEDSYFLYTVRIFDASLARAQTNPKKIYCVDHALVVSVSSNILVNSGHLLENLVFVALRRITSKIYYYKTKKGKEVDFIINKHNKTYLIQVAESINDSKTKKREIEALSEAMEELNLETSFLVTRTISETIQVNDQQTIEVIPAWKFFIDFF